MRSGSEMRRLLATLPVVLVSVVLAACGGGGDDGVAIQEAVPTGASGEVRAGAAVLSSSGCLSCHRIGESGNDGPGPGLDGVGDRLDADALESILVEGRSPMPSFERLGEEKIAQLVAYLGTL